MSRVTASLLLVVLLAGVLAPAAAALAPDFPHACCARKTPHCHHSQDSSETSVRSRTCAQHSCCRSVAVSPWAQTGPRHTYEAVASMGLAILRVQISYRTADLAGFHSVRAPPRA
jgi:hypothetical protein